MPTLQSALNSIPVLVFELQIAMLEALYHVQIAGSRNRQPGQTSGVNLHENARIHAIFLVFPSSFGMIWYKRAEIPISSKFHKEIIALKL
ncbi:hypothetical protein PDE_06393 [Penicillium oxalicum 114-2]|uniref:Uncharacterized protein n=1 Tax=Penicillium oxalicum (strain 114-2 / CGMCC 5302) TaxID=933388 RepID=S8AYI3_PENO1|nr:hypothetical protein PDE_06393 [Penicillium oxalicum 114-2]